MRYPKRIEKYSLFSTTNLSNPVFNLRNLPNWKLCISHRKRVLCQYSQWNYLTIRLFALNFYEVIVDSACGRINYHLIEIESE